MISSMVMRAYSSSTGPVGVGGRLMVGVLVPDLEPPFWEYGRGKRVGKGFLRK